MCSRVVVVSVRISAFCLLFYVMIWWDPFAVCVFLSLVCFYKDLLIKWVGLYVLYCYSWWKLCLFRWRLKNSFRFMVKIHIPMYYFEWIEEWRLVSYKHSVKANLTSWRMAIEDSIYLSKRVTSTSQQVCILNSVFQHKFHFLLHFSHVNSYISICHWRMCASNEAQTM